MSKTSPIYSGSSITLKTFQIVRSHQRQMTQQQQSVQNSTLNAIKCRKFAMTVLYVFDLFVIFCLPGLVVILIETFSGFTKAIKIVYDYVSTAVFINSFLNPAVYCWRIREKRRAVKKVKYLTCNRTI